VSIIVIAHHRKQENRPHEPKKEAGEPSRWSIIMMAAEFAANDTGAGVVAKFVFSPEKAN
jgi:hypothetical protein